MTTRRVVRSTLFALGTAAMIGMVVVVSVSYSSVRNSIHQTELQLSESRTRWARAMAYMSTPDILSAAHRSERLLVRRAFDGLAAVERVRSLHFLGPDYPKVAGALQIIESARNRGYAATPVYPAKAAVEVERALSTVSADFGRYSQLQEEYVSHLNTFVLVVSGIILALFLRGERKNRNLRQAEQKARQMSRFLLSDYESKMHSVALELHDDIAQEIYLALSADSASLVRREHLQSVLEKVRALSQGLRPGEVASLSLNGSLQSLCRKITRTTPLSVTFISSGLELFQPPYESRIQIYRIVQECLMNAVRHSGAGTATVEALLQEGQFLVRVEDSGSGFRFDESNLHTHPGLGIKGMYDRASILGGTVSIDSAPGAGTRVELRLSIGEFSRDRAGLDGSG